MTNEAVIVLQPCQFAQYIIYSNNNNKITTQREGRRDKNNSLIKQKVQFQFHGKINVLIQCQNGHAEDTTNEH